MALGGWSLLRGLEILVLHCLSVSLVLLIGSSLSGVIRFAACHIQVFVASKDGTNIPMFITHKKGLELDGSNPTLLYGYGEIITRTLGKANGPTLS